MACPYLKIRDCRIYKYGDHRIFKIRQGHVLNAVSFFLKNEMGVDQIKLDKVARQLISEELGHERLEILSVYCGK